MLERKHILYSFRRCPYAMRARMGLVRAEIVFDIVEVDLKNKPAAMLKISPKGTVPVLHANDDTVIDESLDIARWACGNNFDETLVAENDGDFKRALDRYKYPSRYPDEDCSDARDRGEEFLKKLDRIVDSHTQSLTDICIFPFVRQFANVDRGWFDSLPYKNLQQWLDANINSELFKLIFDKGFAGFTRLSQP
jgi:glutathione S-transferase